MNLANYPNKAASWLNGVSLASLTCLQVYRDNNRTSPGYVAVVRDSASNTVRACSYATIGKAFSRKDIIAARHAFDQGSLLNPSGILAAPPRVTAAAQATGRADRMAQPAAKVAVSGFINAATNNVDDEDAAMAMMTALVRSARTNQRVANIVKTLASLVN